MSIVLFISSQYLGNGGIPRFNRNLLEAFDNPKSLHLNDTAPTGFAGNKWAFILAATKSVIGYKPKTVILGHLHLVPLALPVKWFTRAKIVVILHGIEAWQERKKIKLFYRFVDQYWSVSSYTSQTFSKTNGVAESLIKPIFNTLPPHWPVKNGRYGNLFLSVTRLDAAEGYKGIDTVLECLKYLAEDMRKLGFSYYLVAHGNDVLRHRRLTETYGIDDIVHIEGNLSDEELQVLYQDCAFFVLPSTGEGFGIVYLEAMANAKACIGAKDCGAADVIVHQKTGYLVKQTVDDLLPCIQNLMLHPEVCESMGKAGLQRLQQHFTFDKFKERIHGLLQKV